VCENGFGKRTPFGPGEVAENGDDDEAVESEAVEAPRPESTAAELIDETPAGDESEETVKSAMSYRRQRRGGKGVRNIKTSERNGKVVDITAVHDEDEVLMVTAGGIIQRIRAGEISRIGRNTQGVRIIRLDDGDKLVSLARVPPEEIEE
jgi:DNA gyrase subunit A